jgi:PD-(D/E)XK nuclease superfamily protein
MDVKRDPRGQGDQGERSAMLWFGERGAAVFMPVFHSPDYDLIADWGEGVARIQVKTSGCLSKGAGTSPSARGVATAAGAGSSSTSIQPATTTCSSWLAMADGG